MRHDPCTEAAAAREDAGPPRRAGRVGLMAAGESDALDGKAVDGRGGGTRIAVTSQVILAATVDIDEEDAHPRSTLNGREDRIHKRRCCSRDNQAATVEQPSTAIRVAV